MGFFSWLTADTDVSVSSRYSIRGARPVHFLQPHGLPTITEPDYEGYGVFGGTDAYEWLARMNVPAADLEGFDFEQLRRIGITLELGGCYRDVETGEMLVFHPNAKAHPIPACVRKLYGLEIRHVCAKFEKRLAEFGNLTLTELIGRGRFVAVKMPSPVFPIKLSYDENAVYVALGASKNCPDQGYFYSQDEDLDDEIEDEEEELDEAA